MSTADLACGYAALLLHDCGSEITADNISTVVKAAGVDVNACYPAIFEKALEGKDFSEVVAAAAPTPGSGGGGGGGGGAAAAGGDAAPAAAAVESSSSEEAA